MTEKSQIKALHAAVYRKFSSAMTLFALCSMVIYYIDPGPLSGMGLFMILGLLFVGASVQPQILRGEISPEMSNFILHLYPIGYSVIGYQTFRFLNGMDIFLAIAVSSIASGFSYYAAYNMSITKSDVRGVVLVALSTSLACILSFVFGFNISFFYMLSCAAGIPISMFFITYYIKFMNYAEKRIDTPERIESVSTFIAIQILVQVINLLIDIFRLMAFFKRNK